MRHDLERLFETVRETQGQELQDGERRLVVRNRLLAEPRRRRAHRARGVALGGTGLALAASTLVVVWLAGRQEQPLTFTVGHRAHAAGDFVAASPHEPAALHFSDGSRLELSPHSAARVDRLTRRGANVRLEHGTAEVKVVHTEETRWALQSGPYTVRVVGTRFRVSWDAKKRTFELLMHEGRVVVQGPELQDRPLVAGETLRIVSRETGETRTSQKMEAPQPSVPSFPAEEKRVPPGVASAEPTGAPPVEAVPSRGLPDDYDRTLRDGSLADVVQLATAVRHAGDPREPAVYRAVRQRFPGTEAAADAAFYLARLYVRRGDAYSATRWLETYLEERPDGRWVREATGRLAETLHSLGRKDEAREVAGGYLQRYPHGPHAAFARSLSSAP